MYEEHTPILFSIFFGEKQKRLIVIKIKLDKQDACNGLLSSNRNDFGFILTEFMLAIIISLLLLSFLFAMYLTNQQTYQLQNELIHLQDSGKTTIAIFKSELHQAGYIGCMRLVSKTPIVSHLPYSVSTKNRLIGDESTFMIRKMELPSTTLKKFLHDTSLIVA